MKLEIDPNNIILLLNKLLASDPKLVLELLKNRPEVTEDVKKLLEIEGNKISFLGILNAILKEHGSDVIIGADCDFDDDEMSYVKFFHLIERK